MLTREEILNTPDLKIVEVEVPEWGGTVKLQELNADAGIALQEEMKKIGDAGSQSGIRELALVLCAIDDEGAPLFKVEDMDALKKKSNRAINRLGEAAWDLVGLGEANEEQAAGN